MSSVAPALGISLELLGIFLGYLMLCFPQDNRTGTCAKSVYDETNYKAYSKLKFACNGVVDRFFIQSTIFYTHLFKSMKIILPVTFKKMQIENWYYALNMTVLLYMCLELITLTYTRNLEFNKIDQINSCGLVSGQSLQNWRKNSIIQKGTKT